MERFDKILFFVDSQAPEAKEIEKVLNFESPALSLNILIPSPSPFCFVKFLESAVNWNVENGVVTERHCVRCTPDIR